LVGGDRHDLDARGVFAKAWTRLGDRLGHFFEDLQASALGLEKCRLHDLLGDTGDLDVHLQRGDAIAGPGDLEIHVAEVILIAQYVGENRKAITFLDKTHGDARHRRLDRDAGIHERQRCAAHRCHGRRAVRFGYLGDDANGVGECLRTRQHGMVRAPSELSMADLATASTAQPARLTDRKWREVIMPKEGLLISAFECIDILLVFAGAERGDDEGLGFAPGEQRRSMGAGKHAYFASDGPDGHEVAAIDATAAREDVAANDILLKVLESVGNRQRRWAFALSGNQRGNDLVLDGRYPVAALLLAGNRIGLPQFRLGKPLYLFSEGGAFVDRYVARLARR